jgi:hypothetical protein
LLFGEPVVQFFCVGRFPFAKAIYSGLDVREQVLIAAPRLAVCVVIDGVVFESDFFDKVVNLNEK